MFVHDNDGQNVVCIVCLCTFIMGQVYTLSLHDEEDVCKVIGLHLLGKKLFPTSWAKIFVCIRAVCLCTFIMGQVYTLSLHDEEDVCKVIGLHLLSIFACICGICVCTFFGGGGYIYTRGVGGV